MEYASCFEPYIAVDKSVVPMYDERFRGYGMNKVRKKKMEKNIK